MKTWMLGVCVCLGAVVGCGEEATNNGEGPAPDMVVMEDMAPDQAQDMSPDMPRVIDGPEDCAQGEWFSSLGPACNVCPAAQQGCALLVNISESSFDVDEDTVSIRLRTAVIEPVSVVLKGEVEDILCMANGGACDVVDRIPFESPMSLMDGVFTVKLMPEDGMSDVVLKSLVVTDKCGTTQEIAISGEWDAFRGRSIEPLACE